MAAAQVARAWRAAEPAVTGAWCFNDNTELARPGRLRVLWPRQGCSLADGERTSGALCAVIQAEFGISQPGVSAHLRVLRDSGFASVRSARSHCRTRTSDGVGKRRSQREPQNRVRPLEKPGVASSRAAVPTSWRSVGKLRRPCISPMTIGRLQATYTTTTRRLAQGDGGIAGPCVGLADQGGRGHLFSTHR
jgi:DNA-binding transcriptional ArsR family regulator